LELTRLAVDDPDVEVAKAATYAIGSVDDGPSVDALETVLADSTRREVRKAAAYALGNLGTPEARTVLIRLAKTEQ
jgi:HEAT repeat protein